VNIGDILKMNDANKEFYRAMDRALIVSTLINSIAIAGFLFMGIALGMIDVLAFIILDPFLWVGSSFLLGFCFSVVSIEIQIRRYERVNGL
jgi:hypothetical protein